MLHSVFKSSKFYVFCQVKQKETDMCYSYKTSLQCHNNNDEIEFLFQRRSGALLQSWWSSARVQEASGWSPRWSQPPIASLAFVIILFLILMWALQEPDQEVAIPPSFSQLLSLCDSMSLATPPSYRLIYLFIEGKANIINLYLQRWLRDQCCLDHLAITKMLNMWLF